jgi:hypothetical protein
VIKLFKLIDELSVPKPKNINSLELDIPSDFLEKKINRFRGSIYRQRKYRVKSLGLLSSPILDADKLRNQCVEIFYMLVNKKQSNLETILSNSISNKFLLGPRKKCVSNPILKNIDRISIHSGIFGYLSLKHSVQIAKEYLELNLVDVKSIESILRSKEEDISQRNCKKYICEEEKKILI